MHKRNSWLLLEDILESITKIEQYTRGLRFEDFAANPMAIDAVVRNLEIIGEAARKLPDDAREQFPDIPWEHIIGLRNRVIHEYFGVDNQIIWKIIQDDLPDVKRKLIR